MDEGQRCGTDAGEVSLLRARLSAILDTTLDPLLLVRPLRDASGRVVDFSIADMNEAHHRAGGDRSTSAPMHLPARSPQLFAMYQRVLETGTTDFLRRVWIGPHPDEPTATAGWADVRATGVAGDVVISWRNVDADVATEERLRAQALQDPLTQLLNRRGLVDVLTAACATPHPFGVLFVDVDDFKSINDRYGHRHGDAVLVATAQRLRGALRDGDVVGRLAGDEFVVLARRLHDMAELERLAVRLLADCASAPYGDADADGADGARVSVSVGGLWVTADGRQRDVTEVLHAADALMYSAKRQGGGQVHLGSLP